MPNGVADTVGFASWAGVPNLRHREIERFVDGPQNLTPCTKLATEMFPETWIVCWRALAAERLVWDCGLRLVGAASARSEKPGSELSARSAMLSSDIPVRRER